MQGNAQGDAARECRICMSADESNDLIAPCRCKGSSKFVHRACLDQWRATKGLQRPLERGERVAQPNSNPFTHCTTCGFKFRIRTVAVVGEEYNLLKYRLYVARDLTGVALALFAALSLLAGVLWLLGTLPFTSDYLLWANPVMHDRAPLAAPGFWPHFVLAVCVALVLLGFVGLILYGTGVFDRMGVRLRTPCQCRNNRCFVGGFGGPILLILVAVFLVVGVFVGIALGGYLITHVLERHLHRLWFREQTKRFVVVDLATDSSVEVF